MRIKVLQVGPIEQKQGPKAAYSVFKLDYEADGRVGSRNIMEFSRDAFKALRDAAVGSFWDVVVEKNGKYYDWKGVTKADGASAASGEARTAPSGGGNWKGESPEERAAKQVYIIRQSSIASAVALVAASGKKDLMNAQDVITCAEAFENWVLNGKSPELDKEPEIV